MKNLNIRFLLSAIALYSIMMAVTTKAVKAAPVQFNQVVQVVNAKPGKAGTSGFAQLRLAGDDVIAVKDDTKTDEPVQPQQDDPRVITETRSEIVEEEVCECEQPKAGGFPYWTLGFAAIPFLFLIPRGDEDGTPTPTTTTTPTPPMTPTPPEPVPEPMTILLFGSGLAGIGLAARRRFGKKTEDETEE
jgi:hypothetical protein